MYTRFSSAMLTDLAEGRDELSFMRLDFCEILVLQGGDACKAKILRGMVATF